MTSRANSTQEVSNWLVKKIGEISDTENIDSDTKISTLGINSVSMVGLMADVEDNFNIEIDDPSVVYQKMYVADIVDFVMESMNG
ncbi:MAG: acyl carrier protein [Pseudomonadota bacterium]